MRSSCSKGGCSNRAPGVLQAVLGFPARSGRTPSGGPTARSRGAPLTGLGRRRPLSAARPASPPRLTNPGSSAKLPSSSESRLDCTSPPLGLLSLRSSPKKHTRKKTARRWLKQLNTTWEIARAFFFFWVKHIELPRKTQEGLISHLPPSGPRTHTDVVPTERQDLVPGGRLPPRRQPHPQVLNRKKAGPQ